jgi:hypothetical protein
VPRVIGKAGDGGARAVIAGPAEDDAAAFAGLVGDRANPGLGGELGFDLEALAHVTQLGEDLGGADPTGPGEGHDDLAIRQLSDGVFDARGELGNLRLNSNQRGGQGSHRFALGCAFRSIVITDSGGR